MQQTRLAEVQDLPACCEVARDCPTLTQSGGGSGSERWTAEGSDLAGPSCLAYVTMLRPASLGGLGGLSSGQGSQPKVKACISPPSLADSTAPKASLRCWHQSCEHHAMYITLHSTTHGRELGPAQVSASMRPVVTSMRALYDACAAAAGGNPRSKREMDNNAARLGHLFWQLNEGKHTCPFPAPCPASYASVPDSQDVQAGQRHQGVEHVTCVVSPQFQQLYTSARPSSAGIVACSPLSGCASLRQSCTAAVPVSAGEPEGLLV